MPVRSSLAAVWTGIPGICVSSGKDSLLYAVMGVHVFQHGLRKSLPRRRARQSTRYIAV